MDKLIQYNIMDNGEAIDKFNRLKPIIKNDYFELDIFFSRIISSGKLNPLLSSDYNHSIYELHIPLSGSARYLINDSVVDVNPDKSYMFMPPSTHKIIDHSNDFSVFTLGFSFVAPINLSLPIASDESFYEITNLPFTVSDIGQVVYLAGEEKTDYYNRINSILTTAIFNIFDNTPIFESELTSVSIYSNIEVVSDDTRIRLAIQYITDNINSPISVNDVADYICISSRQLNRILKNAFNFTTNDLINQLKIKAAKRYMAVPTHSLSQIAVMCGFNSLTHFNLTFKKIMNITPKEFRKSALSKK